MANIKKHIVAVSGYARAGKDTLANGLVTELSRRDILAIKFKFATSLKRSLRRAFDNVGVAFDPETEDEAAKNRVRPLLISYAQFCRAVDPKVFAKHTLMQIDSHFKIGMEVAVVSDMRYSNESEVLHEYCKEFGFGFIHIDIHRRGTYAAHQEELDSIEDLLEANYMSTCFRGVEFSDRDVAGIAMYAAGVADDIAKGREVRNG